jgi:hypothetical protein
MTREVRSEKEAAAALRRALNASDDLTCEQAQELIPEFVDAEMAGEDVQASPRYAALLRHLDNCVDCAELYAALADDLESLLTEGPPAPLPRSIPATFFAPVRETEHVLLRLIRGFTKGFELQLNDPRLSLSRGVLSGGKQIPLFNDNLPEMAGTPAVVVALDTHPETPRVLVAVREPARSTRWRVQLQIGDQSYEALTDEQGIVRLDGFSTEQLQQAGQLTLICTEEQTT